MKNKKYSIIYSSLTGNTKVLADAIHEALPQDECEYFGVSDTVIPSSELLYIGFWTDKGNADTKTLQLLSQLKNKQIFLFGTAGFGGSDIYFRKILGEIPMKEEYGLSMLLASGFLQGCAAKHESGRWGLLLPVGSGEELYPVCRSTYWK